MKFFLIPVSLIYDKMLRNNTDLRTYLINTHVFDSNDLLNVLQGDFVWQKPLLRLREVVRSNLKYEPTLRK